MIYNGNLFLPHIIFGTFKFFELFLKKIIHNYHEKNFHTKSDDLFIGIVQ